MGSSTGKWRKKDVDAIDLEFALVKLQVIRSPAVNVRLADNVEREITTLGMVDFNRVRVTSAICLAKNLIDVTLVGIGNEYRCKATLKLAPIRRAIKRQKRCRFR